MFSRVIFAASIVVEPNPGDEPAPISLGISYVSHFLAASPTRQQCCKPARPDQQFTLDLPSPNG
jgi:hypothetical protein